VGATLRGLWELIGRLVDIFQPEECAKAFSTREHDPDGSKNAPGWPAGRISPARRVALACAKARCVCLIAPPAWPDCGGCADFFCQLPTESAYLAAMTTPYHPPVKHSLSIAGHKTSISLEPKFWEMLREAAQARGMAVAALVAQIDAERITAPTPPGLASAIRVWLVTNR
jgi:predicted DNA-binding ribbon-helix-helix protein